MDISESNYCKTGLGVGTEQCACKLKLKTARRLQGNGPGLSEMMTSTTGPTEPVLILPDSVRTKQELSEFLAQNYERGSEEYRYFYAKYSPNLNF